MINKSEFNLPDVIFNDKRPMLDSFSVMNFVVVFIPPGLASSFRPVWLKYLRMRLSGGWSQSLTVQWTLYEQQSQFGTVSQISVHNSDLPNQRPHILSRISFHKVREIINDIPHATSDLCLLSGSETAVDNVPSFERLDKTGASDRMRVMCCINRAAETAPIRQHIPKQITTEIADRCTRVNSKDSRMCGTILTVQISCPGRLTQPNKCHIIDTKHIVGKLMSEHNQFSPNDPSHDKMNSWSPRNSTPC